MVRSAHSVTVTVTATAARGDAPSTMPYPVSEASAATRARPARFRPARSRIPTHLEQLVEGLDQRPHLATEISDLLDAAIVFGHRPGEFAEGHG